MSQLYDIAYSAKRLQINPHRIMKLKHIDNAEDRDFTICAYKHLLV